MGWTPSQQLVVAHEGGRLQVRGQAGAGKTAALVGRWQRRAVESGRPERVLVLCCSRDAADRFGRDCRAERADAGGWSATTFFGLALDIVQRHGGGFRLLSRAEQWTVVRRMLAEEGPEQWPNCGPLVRRAAFVDEVAAAVLASEGAGTDDDSLLAAAARGGGGHWMDLLAFRRRYRQVTTAMGALDSTQLFSAALDALADGRVAASESDRWDEVLIDDAEMISAPMGRLIDTLGVAVVAAGRSSDEGQGLGGGGDRGWFDQAPWPAFVDLGAGRRATMPPVLLHCSHPAAEPDVIAGALLNAHAAGVAWRDMAVLVRSERQRAPGICRALTRHGIPVRPLPGASAAEPAVRAVTDFFAWAAGDGSALDRLMVSPAVGLAARDLRLLRRSAAPGGPAVTEGAPIGRLVELRDRLAATMASENPADLVHKAWTGLLGTLVPDPDHDGADGSGARALDAVAAFLAAVARRSDHDPTWRMADELALVEGPDFDPDPWVPIARPGPAEQVTVATIAAAVGRAWDTVVIAGCLEGELPRISAGWRFFDAPPMAAVPALTSPATESGRSALADERRLFSTASSRAVRQLISTAAPAPGQVVSRFVAAFAPSAVRLPRPRIAAGTVALSAAPPTESTVPVHVGDHLSLSASRLMAYGNCPLQYFYQYVMGVHGPGGVAATMGTVVHSVLARFLDPARPPERSWDALESLAELRWSEAGCAESIAPYQPMRDQARRDIFAMLQDWWQVESNQADARGGWPDVFAVEYPFAITVAGHRIKGAIDRIDRVPGGIAIIDYKTGSRVARPDDLAVDLQLATYHLAATRDPTLTALGPPVSLQLCYLRSGAQPRQPITDQHASRTEQRIVDTANRILGEEFEPSVEADCEYCDFWRLCPLQVPGRQVAWE